MLNHRTQKYSDFKALMMKARSDSVNLIPKRKEETHRRNFLKKPKEVIGRLGKLRTLWSK